MKTIRDYVVFAWNWYVVRTWEYFFPSKHDDTPPE